jgi:predicted Zn-dependent protease
MPFPLNLVAMRALGASKSLSIESRRRVKPVNRFLLTLTMFCALLALVAGGCAHSPEWDRKVGAEGAKEVEENVGLYGDPKLAAYVNDTGQKVVSEVSNRQYDFQFHIIDQPVANAFSLPGGYVYVTRGLLALTNSPDELACVLGHETTHVIKRHAAQRAEAGTVPGIFAIPGEVVGTVLPVAGDLLAAPARGVGGLFLAGYSRDQEREADRVGQELAFRAGFDPHALSDFLDRLGRYESLPSNKQEHGIPNMFQTHPQTPERVAATRKRAEELVAAATSRPEPHDREAYVAMLDGLVLRDDPAAGIFVGDVFLHPTLGIAFAAPHGWTDQNTPIAVATVSPKQDAAVLLDSPEGVSTPEQGAEQFVAEMRRQDMVVPVVETVTIGDLPARRISIRQEDAGQVDYLEITWVLHRGVTYRLVAIATSSNVDAVRGVVESFHDLTLEERASIKVTRLRIVEVLPGETLVDVSRRIGNQWDVKTTAVMNGVGENEALRAGQRIKVARTEVFGGE